jgi:hypothetical protein
MDSFEEEINKVRLIGNVQNFIFSSFPHLSLKQRIKMKIILEHSCYKTDKVTEVSETNLSQCRLVYHKSLIDRPKIEPVFLRKVRAANHLNHGTTL